MVTAIILSVFLFVIGFIVTVWIYFICRAVLFKVRNVPRRHVKAWIPPILSGIRPGRSAERIFTPLTGLEDEGIEETPTENIVRQPASAVLPSSTLSLSYSSTKEVNENVRNSVFPYREAEEDDWDTGKVTLALSTERKSLDSRPEVRIHKPQSQEDSAVLGFHHEAQASPTRKTYNLTSARRASNHVSAESDPGTNRDLGRASSFRRSVVPPLLPGSPSRLNSGENRRSQSLTNISIEPIGSPPPLPPRRRPGRNDETNLDLQLPPPSVHSIIERNAMIRNSRLMTLTNPFDCFRFESSSGNMGRASMNFVPFCLEPELPPSYEEAIRMNPPNFHHPQQAQECNNVTVETTVEIPPTNPEPIPPVLPIKKPSLQNQRETSV